MCTNSKHSINVISFMFLFSIVYPRKLGVLSNIELRYFKEYKIIQVLQINDYSQCVFPKYKASVSLIFFLVSQKFFNSIIMIQCLLCLHNMVVGFFRAVFAVYTTHLILSSSFVARNLLVEMILSSYLAACSLHSVQCTSIYPLPNLMADEERR